MAADAVVTVQGLVFDYPGKRALHGLGIVVPRGAVLALVGPNGAGKSTLMRVVAGLDEPLEGRVTVAGVDVLAHPRRAQRHIGYLSDFFGLYEELSVRRCLLHAASVRGVAATEASQAVLQAAQRVGLSDRLDMPAGNLSRGLRQRLAIGQAIVHRPDVLLLDEPAAGLDPEARVSLSALFRDLQAGGATLVVSSHILAELEAYSSHMLALREGRVVQFTELGRQVTAGVQRLHVRLARAWQAPAGFWREHGAGLREGEPGQLLMLQVDMPRGDEGAAALLRALVEAGAPVAEFSVRHESLQDSYLRAARAAGAGATA